MSRARRVLLAPLLDENPITLHILGICSAVAITNSLYAAMIMSAALTAVLAYSNVTISLLRRQLPGSVRLIVEVTVIASGVIVVDELLKTFLPETSRILSVFVGLIITNCIVLGRAETFAAQNRPGLSLLDAIGNGIGYSMILVSVAIVRELFGAGTLLDRQIFATVAEGGWFEPNRLFVLPPSAFFIIGGIVWAIRSLKAEQVEQPEFSARSAEETPERLWNP